MRKCCGCTGAAGAFPVKQADLFLGNAGTAFRPLTAALALSGGHYQAVRRAAHARAADRRPGGCAASGRRADIRYLGSEGFPPLEILPARISVDRPVSVRGDVSSQFLTALLMALPLTGRRLRGARSRAS